MSAQIPPSAGGEPPAGSKGDPWHAHGYLVAGVFVYGGLGWLADRWLGTGFLVVIGILLGAGLGIYSTWARFIKQSPAPDAPEQPPRTEPPPRPPDQT